jgi:hypothetical protein
MIAFFPSPTADSIAKSNVLRGSAPSRKPLLLLSNIHRWWRFAYHRLMARIPPGSLCGLRPDRDNPPIPFRKHFCRGPERSARSDKNQRNDSAPGARSCVSQPRLALIRVPQFFVACSEDLGSACSRLPYWLANLSFFRKRCFSISPESVYAQ